MARTDNFRKQHAEIPSFAREVKQQLGASLTEQAATSIRQPSRQMLSNESLKASSLAVVGKVKKRDLTPTLRPYITS